MRFACKIACKSEICCNFGVKSGENGAQNVAKWGKIVIKWWDLMKFCKSAQIRALKWWDLEKLSTNPRPKMWWNDEMMWLCDDDDDISWDWALICDKIMRLSTNLW